MRSKIAALLIFSCLFACGNPVNSTAKLIGSWRWYSRNSTIIPLDFNLVLKFNSGGTVQSFLNGELQTSGTYTISGSTLDVTWSSPPGGFSATFVITGNNLELTVPSVVYSVFHRL